MLFIHFTFLKYLILLKHCQKKTTKKKPLMIEISYIEYADTEHAVTKTPRRSYVCFSLSNCPCSKWLSATVITGFIITNSQLKNLKKKLVLAIATVFSKHFV